LRPGKKRAEQLRNMRRKNEQTYPCNRQQKLFILVAAALYGVGYGWH
jgi:hypothetical protein